MIAIPNNNILLIVSLLLFIGIIALILYECKCNVGGAGDVGGSGTGTAGIAEKFAVAEITSINGPSVGPSVGPSGAPDTSYNSGVSTGPNDPQPNTNIAARKPTKVIAGDSKDKADSSPNDFEKLSKMGLTDNEAEIFHGLRTKNLTDESINNLIDSGVITEKLIEKFLAYVDSMPTSQEKMTVADFIKEDDHDVPLKEKFTNYTGFAYL